MAQLLAPSPLYATNDTIKSDSTAQGKPDSVLVAEGSVSYVSVKECQQMKTTQQAFNYILAGAAGVGIILSLIALILALKANWKSNDALDDLEKTSSKADFESLNWRVTNLSNKVDLMKYQPAPSQSQSRPHLDKATHLAPQEKPSKKARPVIRYFGTNSSNHFTSVENCPNDVTAFRVTFSDDDLNEGEFELTDINRIKSNDNIRDVLDLAGGATISKLKTAMSFETIEKGKVTRNGTMWNVTKKTIIRI